MRTHTLEFTETQTLVTIECYKCHVLFAMPSDLRNRALQNNEISFYCPNGHSQGYVETELDKVRKELVQKQRELEAANSARDSFRKSAEREKSARKRLEKRAANGVCPCCHRRVKQMADHIATKHPEYAQEQNS